MLLKLRLRLCVRACVCASVCLCVCRVAESQHATTNTAKQQMQSFSLVLKRQYPIISEAAIVQFVLEPMKTFRPAAEVASIRDQGLVSSLTRAACELDFVLDLLFGADQAALCQLECVHQPEAHQIAPVADSEPFQNHHETIRCWIMCCKCWQTIAVPSVKLLRGWYSDGVAWQAECRKPYVEHSRGCWGNTQ